jgi:hypothetical protein
VLTKKENLKAIHHFGRWCGDSKLPVRAKKPSQPEHGHGWCSGSDISARGCGRDHLDHKPVRAGPPVQIPNGHWCAKYATTSYYLAKVNELCGCGTMIQSTIYPQTRHHVGVSRASCNAPPGILLTYFLSQRVWFIESPKPLRNIISWGPISRLRLVPLKDCVCCQRGSEWGSVVSGTLKGTGLPVHGAVTPHGSPQPARFCSGPSAKRNLVATALLCLISSIRHNKA